MQINRQIQAVLLTEALVLPATINSRRTAYAATGGRPPLTTAHYAMAATEIQARMIGPVTDATIGRYSHNKPHLPDSTK